MSTISHIVENVKKKMNYFLGNIGRWLIFCPIKSNAQRSTNEFQDKSSQAIWYFLKKRCTRASQPCSKDLSRENTLQEMPVVHRSCWFWYFRFRYMPVISSGAKLLGMEAMVRLWFSEDNKKINLKEEGVCFPLISSKQAGRTREKGT